MNIYIELTACKAVLVFGFQIQETLKDSPTAVSDVHTQECIEIKDFEEHYTPEVGQHILKKFAAFAYDYLSALV